MLECARSVASPRGLRSASRLRVLFRSRQLVLLGTRAIPPVPPQRPNSNRDADTLRCLSAAQEWAEEDCVMWNRNGCRMTHCLLNLTFVCHSRSNSSTLTPCSDWLTDRHDPPQVTRRSESATHRHAQHAHPVALASADFKRFPRAKQLGTAGRATASSSAPTPVPPPRQRQRRPVPLHDGLHYDLASHAELGVRPRATASEAPRGARSAAPSRPIGTRVLRWGEGGR